MSEIIFHIHNNYNISIDSLNPLLENISKSEINEFDISGRTALIHAIQKKLNLKIIEQLLLKGSDPNVTKYVYPLSLALDMIKETRKYGVNLYKLLICYGADVNNIGVKHFIDYIRLIVENNIELHLIPIIYRKANYKMKSYTVHKLMLLILGCSESKLTKYIKVMEIIFMVRDYSREKDLNSLISHITQLFYIGSLDRLWKLFEIIISHMFKNGFEIDPNFTSFNIECYCEKLLRRNVHWIWKEHYLKILIGELKNIWFRCFELCMKMKKDVLFEECTVLKAIQSNEIADAHTMYQLLLRLNEYSYFKYILSYYIREYNYIKLYDVIIYYHNPSILSFDIFTHLSKYLSKDDIFNVLLASI